MGGDGGGVRSFLFGAAHHNKEAAAAAAGAAASAHKAIKSGAQSGVEGVRAPLREVGSAVWEQVRRTASPLYLLPLLIRIAG